MNKSRKLKNYKPRVGRSSRGPKPIPLNPPPFEYKMEIHKTIRYQAGSAAAMINFSFNDLLNSVFIGNTSTTAISALSAIRLKKICIWNTGPNSGTMGTVSLEAQNTTAGVIGAKPLQISDTSNNNSRIARICFKPPKESAHSSWQNIISGSVVTGQQLLIITKVNTGDTMDVTFNAVLNVGDISLNSTQTTPPGTGLIGYNSLPSNSTTGWSPIQ